MTDQNGFKSDHTATNAQPSRPPVDPAAAMVPPPPPPGYALPPYPPPPPPRRGWMKRLATGLVSMLLGLFLLSVVMNIYFGMFFASITGGPHEVTYTDGDGDHENRVVILPITGMIDGDTAGFVRKAMRSLAQDPPRAVVLRVNTGGGGMTASDQIWHELKTFIKKTEEKIPLVASFGTMAASGGYYVSMPTEHIFVEPTTLTGSIGVIANAFTFDELLDKIGVEPEIIVATEATQKDELNPMRPWTDQDRRSLRFILDQAHERFVQIVDEGRADLSLEEVRKVATGKVFTAQQALDYKLVDEEGYLDAAIDKAKELAGFAPSDDPMVTLLQPAQQWGLGPGLSSPVPGPAAVTSQQVRRWVAELSIPRIEYRIAP